MLNDEEMSDPVSESTLNYTFDEIKDGENQTITFKTKADLDNFVKQGDLLTFKNTVGGTFGQDSKRIKDSEKSVNTTVNFIEKTGEEVAGKGKINWKIEVNNNNLKLPTGIIIEDTVGEGLKFNKDLKIDGNHITDYGTISESDGGFTFTFTKAINKKHVLTYSTDVTDDVYQGNTSKYTNEADIKWIGITGGSTSTGDVGVWVTSSVIEKTGGGYDPATHKIIWKVTINSNEIDITDPILTEVLDDKLEYISHSFDKNNAEWKFEKEAMTFKYNGEISGKYTLTLVTKIKDEYKGYFGDNKTQNISNKAKLTGTGVKPSEANANQEIKSQVIEKSAEGYDYTTRTAKWKIVVNQNKMDIDGAVVTDTIGDYHEFVPGSLKISDVTDASSMYKVNGKTITINLGHIIAQKTITFETHIPDDEVDEFFKTNGDKELKNSSILTGDQINGSVKSNSNQPVKNTVVSKKGNYTNGNDFIDWEVVINLNGLKLDEVVLEDKLQKGLIFDMQTVTLTNLNINDDGTYTEGVDREIDTNFVRETNIVTFTIGNINEAYILKFRTDIDDKYYEETFKNTINLSGSNGKQEGIAAEIGVKFQTVDAGGSGSSTVGSITITKVDEHNEEFKLEGAKFAVYGKDGEFIKESGETDSEGKVVIDDVRMGTYDIREIKAPKNYIIDDKPIEVTLAKGLDTKHIPIQFTNSRLKTEVTGKKGWVNGPEKHPTIELQLLRDGKPIKEDDPFVSEGFKNPVELENGIKEHTWSGIDKYDIDGNEYKYTVDEVKTPSYYRKSISEDGLTVTNTYVGYGTSVTGKKVWVNGPEIKPSIELQLYRNGSTYGDPVTLENGETEYTWTGLAGTNSSGSSHSYTVKEVGVPENYTKEESGVTVTNTYEIPEVDITGKKVWVGGPDVKPTIELQLYRDGEKHLEPVQLLDGKTEYTWTKLDKTDIHGKVYEYTIKEVNTPKDYYASEDGLTITNRHISAKIDITGSKIWKGGPELKPTVQLQLYRDGEVFGKPVTLKDGQESYIWKDLDFTNNKADKYVYTVDEVNVPNNYTKTVSEDGLTVTNTYVSPKMDVLGSKVWVGGPDVKPTIELQLYRNNKVYGDPVTLVDGQLTHTWKELDVTDEYGNVYDYSIQEVNLPEDYDAYTSEDGLTITNVHYSEEGSYNPEDPVDPTVPGTGDTPGTEDTPETGGVNKPDVPTTGIENNQLFYMTTLILGGAGLFVLSRKRKEEEI